MAHFTNDRLMSAQEIIDLASFVDFSPAVKFRHRIPRVPRHQPLRSSFMALACEAWEAWRGAKSAPRATIAVLRDEVASPGQIKAGLPPEQWTPCQVEVHLQVHGMVLDGDALLVVTLDAGSADASFSFWAVDPEESAITREASSTTRPISAFIATEPSALAAELERQLIAPEHPGSPSAPPPRL